MNRFELHVSEWKNCKRCNYSKRRKRVVLGKGQLPCDILVIGEAPGDSEDALGVPMVAQAGRLMDRILIKSGIVTANKRGEVWDTPDNDPAHWKYTVSVTNMLGCVPKSYNEDKNWWEKEEPPDDDCVKICKPRLEEWIDFANPRLIITAGKLAEDWFDQTWREAIVLPVREDSEGYPTVTPIVHIVHPASILRKPFVERSVSVQREVARIRIAIKEHLDRGTSCTAIRDNLEGGKNARTQEETGQKQPNKGERQRILDDLDKQFATTKTKRKTGN